MQLLEKEIRFADGDRLVSHLYLDLLDRAREKDMSGSVYVDGMLTATLLAPKTGYTAPRGVPVTVEEDGWLWRWSR